LLNSLKNQKQREALVNKRSVLRTLLLPAQHSFVFAQAKPRVLSYAFVLLKQNNASKTRNCKTKSEKKQQEVKLRL
jgi:hypothetical protein